MRRCVALSMDGKLMGAWASLKEAAAANDLLPPRVWAAITKKKTPLNMIWMYEEDYMRVADKIAAGNLPWRNKKPSRKRGKMRDETKAQMKMTKSRNAMYRKEAIQRHFLEWTVFHVQWLRELKDKWVERGVFGSDPTILADYYEDKRDIEVALLASLLIAAGEQYYDRVQSYRKVMGDHPWEWFKSRGFATVGDAVWVYEANRIFVFFNELWENCFKYGNYSSIEHCITAMHDKMEVSYLEAVRMSVGDLGRSVSLTRMAWVLLVLSDAETFGRGIWNITRKDVAFPIVNNFKMFLRTWMPDFQKLGKDFTDYPALFGMDSVDFYLSFLAYEDLSRYRPMECSRYSTWYNSTYQNGTYHRPYKWLSMLPKIIFSPENENFL